MPDENAKPITPASVNPSDPKMGETIGYNKTMLDKLTVAQNTYNTLKKKGLNDEIYLYKNLKKETEEMFRAGDLGAKEFLDNITSIEDKLQNLEYISKKTQGFFGKMASGVGEAFDSLSNKLGVNIMDASIVGLTIWSLKISDAQRVMGRFVSHTADSFGELGGESADEFFKNYISHAKHRNVASTMFITDMMRQDFNTALFRLGSQLRGPELDATLSGSTERMLKLGQAYGMTTQDMAGKLTTFQDIFQETTKQSSDSIEGLIGLSLKLRVAPSIFLGMVQGLTDAFKIQRIQIDEIVDVYERFYRGGLLGSGTLGTGMSRELTETVISGVANLDMPAITAMMAKTLNLSGQPLLDKVEAFYEATGSTSDKTLSRLQLFQNFFGSFGKDVTQDWLKGTSLIKSYLPGVKDTATATKIWQALKDAHIGETGFDSVTALQMTNEILLDTTSAEELATTTIINTMSMIVRILYSIANKTGGILPELQNDVDTWFGTDDKSRAKQKAEQEAKFAAYNDFLKAHGVQPDSPLASNTGKIGWWDRANNWLKEQNTKMDAMKAVYDPDTSLVSVKTKTTQSPESIRKDLFESFGLSEDQTGPGAYTSASFNAESNAALVRAQQAIANSAIVTGVESNMISPADVASATVRSDFDERKLNAWRSGTAIPTTPDNSHVFRLDVKLDHKAEGVIDLVQTMRKNSAKNNVDYTNRIY